MVNKLNCDADDDIDSCSSSEEINMFNCSTPTREEIYFPNDNKAKSLNLQVLVSLKSTSLEDDN